jgi:methylmalonyl-CoA mutase N-terminal domain/subunit
MEKEFKKLYDELQHLAFLQQVNDEIDKEEKRKNKAARRRKRILTSKTNYVKKSESEKAKALQKAKKKEEAAKYKKLREEEAEKDYLETIKMIEDEEISRRTGNNADGKYSAGYRKRARIPRGYTVYGSYTRVNRHRKSS